MDTDGNHVIINTALDGLSTRTFHATPRVPDSEADQANSYNMLTVRGRGRADDKRRRRTHRHDGKKGFGLRHLPCRMPKEKRVRLKIKLDKIFDQVRRADHDGLVLRSFSNLPSAFCLIAVSTYWSSQSLHTE